MLSTAGTLGAVDIDVPLPPALRHLGDKTRARLSGKADGPLVVALGGISADRRVVSQPGDAAKVEQATKEQVGRLVRTIVGEGADVEVVFGEE